jgi:Ser/Thr protein kinase RdoA (MazF antagonist)
VIQVERRGVASRSVVSDSELLARVRTALGDECVIGVERELSRYSTSATTEDVRVQMADGSVVVLVLKDLSPEAALDGARAARPGFVADLHRELAAYRTLLPRVAGHSAATCHAACDDGIRRWLLLEKVPGVELYQVGDVGVWAAAAAAVAGLHHDLTAGLDEAPGFRDVLLHQDGDYLRQWMRRALSFEAGRGGDHLPALEVVARVHPDVVARLSALPPVVLHGDLYASNVLVVRDAPLRVCPIDWELASLGPAVLDLAALTSGGWSEDDRGAIVSAYWAAMRDPRWRPDREQFGEALDAARLQICVQWLGWSPDWSPPEEHAHDWLSEAYTLADRLLARSGTCDDT